jgi:hypothetical protein
MYLFLLLLLFVHLQGLEVSGWEMRALSCLPWLSQISSLLRGSLLVRGCWKRLIRIETLSIIDNFFLLNQRRMLDRPVFTSRS